jgi:NitT/TauT family transport system ATP-binding protein
MGQPQAVSLFEDAAMSAPKLVISGLSKTFRGDRGDVVALSGVDLTIGDNEFVSLVGTSGCGKSTLLSIVAGLESHDDGIVALSGRPITGPGLDRGVVFQSYTLLPWLTTLGNVEFALLAAGKSRKEAREIASAHLALVGLDGFADRFPSELSGGMKQRVAIARALSYRPNMLLMDEPFGALDALTRHHMQELLARIWEQHRLTVLFVTHDVEEAVYMSDRVAVMSNRPGRIKRIIPIDLPRPRTYEMMGSAEFTRLQREVLAEIRAESIAIAALGDALT